MSEIRTNVINEVAKQLDKDPAVIKDESAFVEDLGADSLDQVELIMALEERFGIEIPDSDAEKLRRVDQAVKYIQDKTGKA